MALNIKQPSQPEAQRLAIGDKLACRITTLEDCVSEKGNEYQMLHVEQTDGFARKLLFSRAVAAVVAHHGLDENSEVVLEVVGFRGPYPDFVLLPALKAGK